MVRVADELRYEDVRPEGVGKKILRGLWKLTKIIAKLIWKGVKLIALGFKAIVKWQWSQYEKWDKELGEEEKRRKKS